MLEDIEIENFRCFQKTKISGFNRVNLIGGKNNAGKTALLEALLLNNCPKPRTIIELKRIRKEPSEVVKAMPERAWDYFFFDLNKKETIKITGTSTNNTSKISKVVELFVTNFLPPDLFEDNKEAKTVLDIISKNDSMISVLQIRVTEDKENTSKYSVIASSNGILSFNLRDSNPVPIIPSFTIISNKDLTEEYDKARLNEKDDEIIKVFQILDPSITGVESFYIGEPTLYLRKDDKRRLPLSLFGDAINRVAAIMLQLINNEYKILLIDEIENGIHYTNHRDFWETLFRLSLELDIQIFATTHSLEMIKAFADIGLENYEGSGTYVELAPNKRTNSIIGIDRDLSTLKYALEHGKGVRGD